MHLHLDNGMYAIHKLLTSSNILKRTLLYTKSIHVTTCPYPSNEVYQHSYKEHSKISKMAKLRWEMLYNTGNITALTRYFDIQI